MPTDRSIEVRIEELEQQLGRWKRIASVGVGLGVLLAVMGAAEVQQDVRARKIDADTLSVRTIYLQDDQGRIRGVLRGGGVFGGGGPELEFRDEAGRQRVVLSAESDLSTLFLSAGDLSPSVSIRASSQKLLPTGFDVHDRRGVSRISAKIRSGDLDSLAHFQLTDKDDKPAVYMSSADWGGEVSVFSTQGRIDLESKIDASGQSESQMTVWQRAGRGDVERIRVGMEKGEPRIEILRPGTLTQRESKSPR